MENICILSFSTNRPEAKYFTVRRTGSLPIMNGILRNCCVYPLIQQIYADKNRLCYVHTYVSGNYRTAFCTQSETDIYNRCALKKETEERKCSKQVIYRLYQLLTINSAREVPF